MTSRLKIHFIKPTSEVCISFILCLALFFSFLDQESKLISNLENIKQVGINSMQFVICVLSWIWNLDLSVGEA